VKFTILKPIAAVALTLAAVLPAAAQSAEAPLAPTNSSELQVCCRSLTKWSSSRHWVLRGLNMTVVNHLHHCYVDFPAGVVVPGFGAPIQTAGIHPLEPGNNNKQPILDQSADNSDRGGYCKAVKDATPEKIARLADEISGGTCYSCGLNYHNRPFQGCFNNSNTYVFELVREAGMTPPPMRGAPGYRRHHECAPGTATKGTQP
jgi:hypothetical protein